MKWNIMLVDDEENQIKILKSFFEAKKFAVECARSKNDALARLENFRPDVIVTDFAMPDGSGLELIVEARKAFPEVAAIIVTAYGTIRTAVEAIKNGAENFLEKPINLELLEIIIRNALENRKRDVEHSVLKNQLIDPSPGLIGEDAAIARVRQIVAKVAPLDTNVLITGETGAGKEVVASLIWRNSERSGRTYLKINCASIPETLFESELFGHEKGAFTGAAERKAGMIEAANGGTLLLDEIGDMPLSVQPKLLRFLESREYYRVGSTKPLKADVRLLFATKADLARAVAERKFREDLYFRINVVNIDVPPLRERKGDIAALFCHFVKIVARKINREEPKIDEGFMKAIAGYAWPGNVRELINSVERILIFCRPGRITAEDFADVGTRAPAADVSSEILATFGPNLGEAIEKLERMYIGDALKSSKNQTEAAIKLGVSERVLRYKMKNLNL